MQPTQFSILMIEDMARYHELFAREITDALPAQVSFATNGKEAVADLEKGAAPDLILLDLNLPGMHGKQVLERIRANPKFDHVPVIILTGDASSQTQTELLELGANDFIEKGCMPQVFIARLKTHIRQKQVYDRLSRLAVDRDIFAAGVLHDIRGIQTTLLATCELIEMQAANAADLTKNLPQIMTDIASLKTQVNRIGAYASEVIQKVRDTQRALKIGPQDLLKIFSWVEASQSSEGQPAPLERLMPEPLQPVYADEDFLRLIVLNIFQNSVRYSKPGGQPRLLITQTASTKLREQDKHRVITRFRDYGIGINPEQLRKVFQPFYRGSSAKDTAGTGLGLSVAAKVTLMMGGQIWAELPTDSDGGCVICLEL